MPDATTCRDVTGADVVIHEFTDPGCPWAYSAEPFRRRINWLYGDRVAWRTVMVGLAEAPEDWTERGYTSSRWPRAMARISHEHGMPIDTTPRERHSATTPACRAVIGVRLQRPGVRAAHPAPAARAVHGGPPARHARDDPRRRDAPPAWTPTTSSAGRRTYDVADALALDMERARRPLPAARVLDEKLANWSGGQRYTCPSYEICRVADDVRIAVPGFQPFAAYDVILANLVPGTERRDPPTIVEEVLAWTGTPLATREVAVVCDISPRARPRAARPRRRRGPRRLRRLLDAARRLSVSRARAPRARPAGPAATRAARRRRPDPRRRTARSAPRRRGCRRRGRRRCPAACRR